VKEEHNDGLDGTLYSLITCKHNPPHNTNRIITGKSTNREGDVTAGTDVPACFGWMKSLCEMRLT
jgi:hypothetical protein